MSIQPNRSASLKRGGGLVTPESRVKVVGVNCTLQQQTGTCVQASCSKKTEDNLYNWITHFFTCKLSDVSGKNFQYDLSTWKVVFANMDHFIKKYQELQYAGRNGLSAYMPNFIDSMPTVNLIL